MPIIIKDSDSRLNLASNFDFREAYDWWIIHSHWRAKRLKLVAWKYTIAGICCGKLPPNDNLEYDCRMQAKLAKVGYRAHVLDHKHVNIFW